jgi:cysteine desulfurase
VVTSPAEHKAVLEAAHQVQRAGGEERHFQLSTSGEIDLAHAKTIIGSDVAVVSAMWINNEVGTIQPIAEIGAMAKAAGAIMHTDGVQAFGKMPIDCATLPVDVLTISGHKIGAPKGIGALYVRRGTPYEPLMVGGSQERGRRPGTENVAAAVALATAAEIAVAERESNWTKYAALRDELQGRILALVPDAIVHGVGAARAPHILNIAAPGTESEGMLMALDLAGIAASGGSACQSGSVNPSHVLAAMGVKSEHAAGAVRLSVGALTKAEMLPRVAEVFAGAVASARAFAAL